jgi:hypothetical protein
MSLESVWYFQERRMLGLELFRSEIALGGSKLLHSKRLWCRQNPGNQMFGLSSNGCTPYMPFSRVHAWPYSSTHHHVGRFRPAPDKASSSTWFCMTVRSFRAFRDRPILSNRAFVTHDLKNGGEERLFHFMTHSTHASSHFVHVRNGSEEGTSDTVT